MFHNISIRINICIYIYTYIHLLTPEPSQTWPALQAAAAAAAMALVCPAGQGWATLKILYINRYIFSIYVATQTDRKKKRLSGF